MVCSFLKKLSDLEVLRIKTVVTGGLLVPHALLLTEPLPEVREDLRPPALSDTLANLHHPKEILDVYAFRFWSRVAFHCGRSFQHYTHAHTCNQISIQHIIH